MLLRDSQVIEIFRELPEHRGCKSEELEAVEKEFDVRLPLVYCDLMKLDETRLAGAGIVAPLNRLGELRREAASILVEDGHSFRLGPSDIVFAWEDIFAFYFFTANGTIDPPVMMFNYYDSGNNGQAVIQSDTLTAYFAEALRRYLTLN